jgi:hypothetical protein
MANNGCKDGSEEHKQSSIANTLAGAESGKSHVRAGG